MNINKQITNYLNTLDIHRSDDLKILHHFIIKTFPNIKLWFLDGKNTDGKIVSNPNIGYGSYILKLSNGKTREFYKIGLSANTTGISVYIMGLDDKKYLEKNYADSIGKAKVTSYCIKFKSLAEIKIDYLEKCIKECIKL